MAVPAERGPWGVRSFTVAQKKMLKVTLVLAATRCMCEHGWVSPWGQYLGTVGNWCQGEMTMLSGDSFLVIAMTTLAKLKIEECS